MSESDPSLQEEADEAVTQAEQIVNLPSTPFRQPGLLDAQTPSNFYLMPPPDLFLGSPLELMAASPEWSEATTRKVAAIIIIGAAAVSALSCAISANFTQIEKLLSGY